MASQQAGNGHRAEPSASAQPAAGIAASGTTPAEIAAIEAGRVPTGQGPGGEAAAELQPPLPNGTTAGAAPNDVAAPEAGDGKPATGTQASGVAAEPPAPEQTAAEVKPPQQAGKAKDAAEVEPGGAAAEPGLSSKAALASLVDAVPIDSKPGIERSDLSLISFYDRRCCARRFPAACSVLLFFFIGERQKTQETNQVLAVIYANAQANISADWLVLDG